uniref:Nucleotide-diphospho-sugar transferase domain-containing protein n=2 Tax=Zea mays TaxID=4577 RepID=A0A804M7E3_MAIZE
MYFGSIIFLDGKSQGKAYIGVSASTGQKLAVSLVIWLLVPEAMGSRQAAAFLLGCVAALTVVVLLLQRRPEELTSRAPLLQVFGGGGAGPSPSPSQSSSSSPPADSNNTTAAAGDPRLPPPPNHGEDEDEDEDEEEFRGLAAAVSRAATADDRTVIITCVNQAWAAPGSLLDLFLESFRVGDGTAPLLRHLLIVAMDAAAMARCRALHPHCYLYSPARGVDFAPAKPFLSRDYLELVWSKLRLQRRVLRLGYSLLFTDADVLWLRNPLKHVTAYADMTVSCDVFFGDPDGVDNFPNTGFFHVRPNSRTIAMAAAWHRARDRFPGKNEQPVFNAIKKGLVADLGLRLQYIDPAFVAGFCSYGRDLGKVCTMHANCCVGLRAKITDLRTLLHDWKNYTAMPHWAKHQAKWTVPGACIH